MAKQSTGDVARQRLFGSGPAPSTSPTKPAAPKREATASPKADSKPSPKTPASKPASKRQPSAPKASRASSKAEKPKTNYLGNGRYLHKGREMRKMSVYVSPELVPALKAAGASGKDPRGNDMSEIVEALIREAGYGDD